MALKIESFKNFATIFEILATIVISTFLAKIKILKSQYRYNAIPQLIFLGCRETAQAGGEILTKFSSTFCEYFASS